VVPDPHTSCGPYSPVGSNHLQLLTAEEDEQRVMRPADATDVHHDTMGIIALDVDGNVASGTTTNGATFKIPGFVIAALLCSPPTGKPRYALPFVSLLVCLSVLCVF